MQAEIRGSRAIAGLAVSLLIASGTNAVALELESNVPCSEGAIAQLNYGNHTSGCVIGPTSLDQDNFQFTAEEGDRIRIVVAGRSDGFDPYFQVFHLESATLLVQGQCSAGGAGRCITDNSAVVSLAGGYEVVVFDWSFDDTGAYDLQLELLSPGAAYPSLNEGQSVEDSVGPTTDHDHWIFAGRKDKQVRILMAGRSAGLDPYFQVWGPDGQFVLQSQCSSGEGTCVADNAVTLPATGVYSIAAFDWSFDEIGDYELSIQCLTSDCQCAQPGCQGEFEGDKFAIELPGSEISGINGAGGWKCPQRGQLTVSFDGGPPLTAARKLPRNDTAAECGNDGRNGFLIEFNYGLLGPGQHTVRFFDSGTQFAEKTFAVGTLGAEFVPNLSGEFDLNGFPEPGSQTRVKWREELQSFVILGPAN